MAIHGRAATEQEGDWSLLVDPDELISCLCVTRGRVALLGRAVGCFLEQTHAQRELLILFESDDAATRDYVASLADLRIRGIEVPVLPKQTLGSLAQPCRRRGSRALRLPVG